MSTTQSISLSSVCRSCASSSLSRTVSPVQVTLCAQFTSHSVCPPFLPTSPSCFCTLCPILPVQISLALVCVPSLAHGSYAILSALLCVSPALPISTSSSVSCCMCTVLPASPSFFSTMCPVLPTGVMPLQVSLAKCVQLCPLELCQFCLPVQISLVLLCVPRSAHQSYASSARQCKSLSLCVTSSAHQGFEPLTCTIAVNCVYHYTTQTWESHTNSVN